ncbi:MAG: glycosyltransferase [Burkholderiaceae bacterium]
MILIVTPYGPETGSGNWRTADRYHRLLMQAGVAASTVVGEPSVADLSSASCGLLLHARRSHAAGVRFAQAGKPYAVVLTGTDLYADLQGHTSTAWRQQAEQTILGSKAVVGLQADACNCLRGLLPQAPPCVVIPQTTGFRAGVQSSAHARAQAWSAPPASLHTLLVGHVRPEKDPLTAYRAVTLLAQAQQPLPVCLTHLGGVLDAGLDAQLAAWVHEQHAPVQREGQVPHERVRQAMLEADLLVAPSRMEGGALVLAEAAAVGLPIVASRIPGHVGILGEQHPGWFEPGDAADLSARLQRWLSSRSDRQALQLASDAARQRLTNHQAEVASLLSVLERLQAAAA